MTIKRADRVAAKAEAPASDEVAYVLHYDRGQNSAVSVGNYDEAIFGQSYGAELMSAVKGMTIASIDVYFEAVPDAAAIQIYENDGEGFVVVAEKEFTPAATSWNHVEFDNAYTISGKEIIYAVKVTGMKAGKFYVGIDEGPASRGFGDLCNVGGTTWWSMADLGIDSNFCVRANVTGTRTAELSWITVDKNEMTVAPGASETLKVSLNRANLFDGVYEGSIVFNTNDPLCPTKTIPVYMAKNINVGIDAAAMHSVKAIFDGSNLVLTADKSISAVRIYSVAGMTVASNVVAGNRVAVSLDACQSGIYMVNVRFADGSKETLKLAIRR